MNSRFKVLVAEKEIRENRSISVRVIVEESKASRSAVERLLKNTIKNVPLDDLAAICNWVPCRIEDVLKLEEVNAQ